MILQDVMNLIINKENKNLIVFVGDDRDFINLYINNYAKALNKEIEIFNTLKDAIEESEGSLIGINSIKVVREDITLFKDTTRWNRIIESDDNFILTFTSLDKASEFKKHFKDYIVEIPIIEEKYLIKQIKTKIDLEEESIKLLITNSRGNYTLILNEIDKVVNLSRKLKINEERAFKRLYRENQIGEKEKVDINILVDELLNNNFSHLDSMNFIEPFSLMGYLISIVSALYITRNTKDNELVKKILPNMSDKAINFYRMFKKTSFKEPRLKQIITNLNLLSIKIKEGKILNSAINNSIILIMTNEYFNLENIK